MSILRQKKIILTAIIPLFLIIGLSIQSYATTSITSTTYTGLAGITYTVNSAAGFNLYQPAYTVVLTPVTSEANTWSNHGIMSTILEENNWQFQANVTANAAITSAAHTITVQVDSGSGYTTVGAITFTSAVADKDSMIVKFDMGTAALPDGSAIVITIT